MTAHRAERVLPLPRHDCGVGASDHHYEGHHAVDVPACRPALVHRNYRRPIAKSRPATHGGDWPWPRHAFSYQPRRSTYPYLGARRHKLELEARSRAFFGFSAPYSQFCVSVIALCAGKRRIATVKTSTSSWRIGHGENRDPHSRFGRGHRSASEGASAAMK